MIKLAVVGLGDIAHKGYLPLLSGWEGTQLMFCTRSQSRLDQAMQRFRVQQGTTDLDELIAWQPQAALVLTATVSHFEITHKLLQAGIDVLVEKPATLHASQTRTLAETADAYGRILMVGFNRRYAPLAQRARSVWGERPVDMAIFERHRATLLHPDTRAHMVEDCIHLVDMLRYLCGEARAVHTSSYEADGKFVHGTSVLEMDNHATILLQSSQRAGQWLERYTLHGASATLTLEAFSELKLLEKGCEQIWREPYSSSWETNLKGRGFQGEIQHFLEHIQSREQPLTSAWDSVKTQELVEALLRVQEQTGG
ncbi:MAG: Gfo/Idh/MocA family oxidoreductase [Anaerolineaceae bacterium]|nr:Gfo/Idh/MocA family oxidoreductase [Anaerolineaceae bacterium]